MLHAMRLPDWLKQFIRRIEAMLTPRKHAVLHRGSVHRFVRSRWWDDAHQLSFDQEIKPYFEALPPDFSPGGIIDAGAATGLFAVAAAVAFPGATIHAFEPSTRQRIILKRNAKANGVRRRVLVHAVGLWNRTTTLSFRTHGSISALEAANSLPISLPFNETVSVITLDDWVKKHRPERLDLVKMDIEGAEIEALEGASETIRRFHPLLLVQAYHMRQDARTLERCAALLVELGYHVRELSPPSGFLRAEFVGAVLDSAGQGT